MEAKIIYMGNIFNSDFGTGYAGAVYHPAGISPCLNTCGGGNREPLILVNTPDDMEMKILSYSRDSKGKIISHHAKEVANTLCPGNLGGARNTSQYVLHPQNNQTMEQTEQTRYRIRKLTPRECFRLMDVDDDRIDQIQNATVTKGKGEKARQVPAISKSQQYKLAGNSIVVACLYHIFRKMFVQTDTEQPCQLTIFDMLEP